MTIPNELLQFKTCASSFPLMDNCIKKLNESSNESKNAINEAKEEVKLYYKSSNLDAILNNLSSCTGAYDGIISGANTLKSIVSSCNSLIAKITNLENILTRIGELESEIQKRKDAAKEDEYVDTGDLEREINELKSNFESECSSALSLLSQIKGMDTSV